MELEMKENGKPKMTPLGVIFLLVCFGLAVLFFVLFFPLSLIFLLVAIVVSVILAIRNAINSASKSPLLKAASRGDLETCRQRIEAGTPVDQTSAFGDTALIFAAIQGNPELVAYLVSKGADVNVHGEGGRTSLIAAVQNPSDKQLAVMELLAKSGVEIDARDKARSTALAYAVRQGNVEGVRLLLENGASATQGHFVGDKLFSLLSLVPTAKPEIRRMLEAKGAHETIAEWTGDF